MFRPDRFGIKQLRCGCLSDNLRGCVVLTEGSSIKTIPYSLRIKGLRSADGTVSAKELKELLEDIELTAQRGLRLLLDGASVKRGTVPHWLEASANFVITDFKPGSTILEVEAPAFGDTVDEEMLQPDFWREMPGADDSVFSVMQKCLKDAEAENLDSDRFDRGVLDGLSRFGRFFKHADSLEICRMDGKDESFTISATSMEHVNKLRAKTPAPQAMVVSGKLEQVTYKTGRFLMELPGGMQLRGRVHPEFLDAEDMRNLWGKKVSVKGLVHFKPSGAARFVDAELLKLMDPSEEIFERLPMAVQIEAPFEGMIQGAREAVEVSEVWNQWPGDESIEELLADL